MCNSLPISMGVGPHPLRKLSFYNPEWVTPERRSIFMQNKKTKTHTRNMKKTEKKLRIYDSIKQAAAHENMSRDMLIALKGRGCPAFRNSRVYADELWVWIRANGDKLNEQRPKTLDDQFEEKWASLGFAHARVSLFLQEHPDLFPKAKALVVGEILDALDKACRTIYDNLDDDNADLVLKPQGKR